MSEQYKQSSVFVNVAAIIVILAAVRIMEPIISPFLISIFISAISAPGMFWLMQHKIPQSLSITIMLCIIFIASMIIFNVVGTSLSLFIADLPHYQEKLHQVTINFFPILNGLGLTVNADELNKIFDLGAVMGFVGKTFKGLLNTLTDVFLILLLVVFILIEFASFKNKMHKIMISEKISEFKIEILCIC